jgi:hypothetical protein
MCCNNVMLCYFMLLFLYAVCVYLISPFLLLIQKAMKVVVHMMSMTLILLKCNPSFYLNIYLSSQGDDDDEMDVSEEGEKIKVVEKKKNLAIISHF